MVDKWGVDQKLRQSLGDFYFFSPNLVVRSNKNEIAEPDTNPGYRDDR